jgi:hypothetical protein
MKLRNGKQMSHADRDFVINGGHIEQSFQITPGGALLQQHRHDSPQPQNRRWMLIVLATTAFATLLLCFL